MTTNDKDSLLKITVYEEKQADVRVDPICFYDGLDEHVAREKQEETRGLLRKIEADYKVGEYDTMIDDGDGNITRI